MDNSPAITLTNISTRGFVDINQNVMIGGFISGDGIVRVIVRALGPTLSAVWRYQCVGRSGAGCARCAGKLARN